MFRMNGKKTYTHLYVEHVVMSYVVREPEIRQIYVVGAERFQDIVRAERFQDIEYFA